MNNFSRIRFIGFKVEDDQNKYYFVGVNIQLIEMSPIQLLDVVRSLEALGETILIKKDLSVHVCMYDKRDVSRI